MSSKSFSLGKLGYLKTEGSCWGKKILTEYSNFSCFQHPKAPIPMPTDEGGEERRADGQSARVAQMPRVAHLSCAGELHVEGFFCLSLEKNLSIYLSFFPSSFFSLSFNPPLIPGHAAIQQLLASYEHPPPQVKKSCRFEGENEDNHAPAHSFFGFVSLMRPFFLFFPPRPGGSVAARPCGG